MRINVDELLLGVAGVSATLLGTFIVGVFFYIDTGYAPPTHGVGHGRSLSAFRCALGRSSYTRWRSSHLWLSRRWTHSGVQRTFIALSAILAVSTVDTGWRMLMEGGSGNSRALLVNQWTSTAAVVVLIVLPWIIGGWAPPTSAFVPSILIALAAGFTSTAALIMSQFDATAAMADPADPSHEPDTAEP